MDTKFLGLVVWAACFVWATGCGTEKTPDDQTADECAAGQVQCGSVCIDAIDTSAFAPVYEATMAKGCAASQCHDSIQPKEELDLSSTAVAYDALVDVDSLQDPARKLVAVGQADDSYLVDKLRERNLANTVAGDPSQIMPKGGPALCNAKIAAIEEWINAGAPQ